MAWQLRVRFDDDFEREDAGSIEQQLKSRYGPDFDKRLGWTVRRFYEEWMLPSVLVPEAAAKGTLDGYEDMFPYWEAITRDPPLGLLQDSDCSTFANVLPKWGYTRRGVGRGRSCPIGPLAEHPSYTPLAPRTIASHVSRLSTLISRAGPPQTLRKRSARVLRELPYIPLVAATSDTKDHFLLEDAQAIFAACTHMTRPQSLLRAGWSPPKWFRLRVALLYFTGLRLGTVVRLAWGHLKGEPGGQWFDVPGAIVSKTRKAIKMAVHPQLGALLAEMPRGKPEELIHPRGCGRRYFLELHERLQLAAAIPRERLQSPHAWRRTHGVQMDLLGASEGRRIAQLALDHAHQRTTQQSYVGDVVLNQLRMLLPPLA